MFAEFADADLDQPDTALNAVYGNCENISIDYGIMEKPSQRASRACATSDGATWVPGAA